MATCILVDDFAREISVREVLPVMIGELVENGVREKDIKFWIVVGTHRDMTVDEQKKKVGEDVYKGFETRICNCKGTTNLTFLGKTYMGLRISENRSRLRVGGRITGQEWWKCFGKSKKREEVAQNEEHSV